MVENSESSVVVIRVDDGDDNNANKVQGNNGKFPNSNVSVNVSNCSSALPPSNGMDNTEPPEPINVDNVIPNLAPGLIKKEKKSGSKNITEKV